MTYQSVSAKVLDNACDHQILAGVVRFAEGSLDRYRCNHRSRHHYFSSKDGLSLRCVHKSAAEFCARLRAIAVELAPGDKPCALFRAQEPIDVREYRQSSQ